MTRALVVTLAFAAAGSSIDPHEVLRRGDPGRLSPQAFRARLRLVRGDRAQDVEVWHEGRSRTLVRLLAPKERGKFLLRREDALWLISPRTKRPTRLPTSYRLYGGASLDEVLGRFHAEDYEPAGPTEEGKEEETQILSLRLAARDPKSPFPRVRLVVQAADYRALRVEYWLRSGKAASVVEFTEWEAGRPRRLMVRDLLHPEASVTVDVLRLEERPIPPGLFDLEDGAARASLPEPLSASGSH